MHASPTWAEGCDLASVLNASVNNLVWVCIILHLVASPLNVRRGVQQLLDVVDSTLHERIVLILRAVESVHVLLMNTTCVVYSTEQGADSRVHLQGQWGLYSLPSGLRYNRNTSTKKQCITCVSTVTNTFSAES